MAPFGGDWNEDPKEFLDRFFQCMATAGDEFKAKQFIYYLQAGSYADEWYEELPQQEQQNWVSVEALFRKRWLKEEVISIKETITIENEHQPAPTTSSPSTHFTIPKPIARTSPKATTSATSATCHTT